MLGVSVIRKIRKSHIGVVRFKGSVNVVKRLTCNALAYNGQNSLQQYMFDYLRSIFEQNVRELSPDASAEDTRKIGQFFAGAMMGILIPWVLSGMKSNALSNMSELSIPVFNHEIMQKLLRGDPQ